MSSIIFSPNGYERLVVFGQLASRDKHMELLVKDINGDVVHSEEITSKTFSTTITLAQSGKLTLQLVNGKIDIAYLDGHKDLLDCGVQYIIDAQYNDQYRNQCHFSPVRGWMNDPNGLAFFNGYIHLFYQFNPFSQKWANMHWGHSVSKDMVHWKPLPVTFFPQPELQDRDDLRGGAFSGSSLVEGGVLSAYFTRHYGAIDRSWAEEIQVVATSDDGITFSDETVVLKPELEGVKNNFRDPKVFIHEGMYYMVVGGTRFNVPTVFLYSSKDGRAWEFISLLYQEKDLQYAVAECPDFFELNGRWVLLVGFINSSSATDRTPQRDVCYFIGDFDGSIFSIDSRGILDQGKDYYAVQTFELDGRRICFGWNSDYLNLHKPMEGAANGTLSFPRELRVAGGILIQKPADELATLHGKPFLAQSNSLVAPERGTRQFVVTLNATGLKHFQIDLLCSDDGEVMIAYENGMFSSSVSGRQNFIFPVPNCKKVQIYVDTSLIEFFINDGEFAGAYRYYLDGEVTIVCSLKIEATSHQFEGSVLRSIWR